MSKKEKEALKEDKAQQESSVEEMEDSEAEDIVGGGTGKSPEGLYWATNHSGSGVGFGE